MLRRSSALVALLVVGALIATACSGGSSAPPATLGTFPPIVTTTSTTPPTTAPVPLDWRVDTSACADPAAATAPITGAITIGSVMPLSGGLAAATYAPTKAGFEAYIKYANDQHLLGDHHLDLAIQDDQLLASKTAAAVQKGIAAGAQLFAAIVGTPDNLVAREALNTQCIPQLNALTGSPAWGDPTNYPWTTGLLVPYTIEAKVYADAIAATFPSGAKVAMISVNSEFGQVYADSFKDIAAKDHLTIVSEQTIVAGDVSAPAAQLQAIAATRPDAVFAVPLGPGCITFLAALTAVKAQTAGWSPATYVTNTCATSLLLDAAGATADGVLTSTTQVDVDDPTQADLPGVRTFLTAMQGAGVTARLDDAAVGWTAGEVTVAILQQAAASATGLTRAAIIDAARNFSYTPSLAVKGIVDVADGDTDANLAESLQIVRYDATSKQFAAVGSLVTTYETASAKN